MKITSYKISKYRNEFQVAKRKIESWRTCLDIGAHVGGCSLLYAKEFEKVYAFEPIEHIYQKLKKNVELLDNVVVYNRAISDFKGEVEIYEHQIKSELNTVYSDETDYWINRPEFKKESTIKKNVACVKIDDFNFKDVDFIKIDTERYVTPVIMGMKILLTTQSPVLQIECPLPSIDSFLEGLGYKIFHKTPDDTYYSK